MIYWRQMLIEINLERKRTSANYTNTHSHSEFLHSFIHSISLVFVLNVKFWEKNVKAKWNGCSLS